MKLTPLQPAGPAFPVPGQEFVETRRRVVGDAAQNVGEPRLRIDAIELGGSNQGVDCSGALAATIGTCEQPRLSAESDTAQSALGGVVSGR